ncbi:MAG: hypothetical protein AAFX07_15165, partial [Pseudomonadota bacterium]
SESVRGDGLGQARSENAGGDFLTDWSREVQQALSGEVKIVWDFAKADISRTVAKSATCKFTPSKLLRDSRMAEVAAAWRRINFRLCRKFCVASALSAKSRGPVRALPKPSPPGD